MNKSQQTHSKRIINKKLHNLINSIVNKYRDINRGGCGMFAVLLADQLEKHHIEYNFVFNTPSLIDKDSDTEYFKSISKYQLNKRYLTAKHIAIKIKRTYYNLGDDIKSNFIELPKNLNGYIKRNIKESIGFGRQCWNHDFDLDDIKNIRCILNSEFKNCIKD